MPNRLKRKLTDVMLALSIALLLLAPPAFNLDETDTTSTVADAQRAAQAQARKAKANTGLCDGATYRETEDGDALCTPSGDVAGATMVAAR